MILRYLKLKLQNLSPGFWIVSALAVVTTIPFLMTLDMFFDGVTYASISRNLSQGFGDVFHLKFSDNLLQRFYEHPPLGLWVHSVLYTVFGDYLWVDRLMCYSCLAVSLVLIKNIWQFSTPNCKYLWWWPCLLFLTNELTIWVYQNNLLENLMHVFTLLGIYYFLLSTCHTQTKRLLYVTLGALAVGAAVYTKGPVGLFPVSVPFIYAIFNNGSRNKSQILMDYLAIFICFGLLILLHFVGPQGLLEHWTLYLNKQVVGNLNHTEFSIENFRLIFDLFSKLCIPLAIVLLLRLSLGTSQPLHSRQRLGWMFLVIAVGGSFPVIMSQKRSTFYLFPSLSIYSMSMAYFAINVGNVLYEVIHKVGTRKKISLISFTLIVLSPVLMFTFKDRSLFDRRYPMDLGAKNLDPNLYQFSNGFACPEPLLHDWAAMAYAQRFQKISYFPTEGQNISSVYYLTTASELKKKCQPPKEYLEITGTNSKEFKLFAHPASVPNK